MLTELDKYNKTISNSDLFLNYEISEQYYEWINFIFSDLNVDNIDNIKKFLGKENYRNYIIDKLGNSYYSGDDWGSILELLNFYQIDHDYFLEKCRQKVYYTYSYNETGPMSWEHYEYYCKKPKILKKELFNFIIEDIKSIRIRGKVDPLYNLPPQELNILYPNGRKRKWNYYESKFPKNLICISHPTIFGKKLPFNQSIFIESKYRFKPLLLKSSLEDFFSFNKLYPGCFEKINFDIPGFDLFLNILTNKKIYSSSGYVKKSIWLKMIQNYLDSLLLDNSFKIKKTTIHYENKNGLSFLDFYWSNDCDKSYKLISKHLNYRNSLFESLFSRPEEKGRYYFNRSQHLKNYGSFPKSFNEFFIQNNWRMNY